MLDSPDYPKAYLRVGDYELAFCEARLAGDDEVIAMVSIGVKKGTQ